MDIPKGPRRDRPTPPERSGASTSRHHQPWSSEHVSSSTPRAVSSAAVASVSTLPRGPPYPGLQRSHSQTSRGGFHGAWSGGGIEHTGYGAGHDERRGNGVGQGGSMSFPYRRSDAPERNGVSHLQLPGRFITGKGDAASWDKWRRSITEDLKGKRMQVTNVQIEFVA